MWWFFFILFILISIFSTTALIYALRRINQYENKILEFQKIVTYATEVMKIVDSKGHYESDDETGFFFKQLKDLQLLLDGLFEVEEEKDKVEKTNAKNKS